MIIIRPTQERRPLEVVELWPFRYLFLIFVWRTLKVRYQQTAIGIAWAVLRPLLMTIVFTVIFGLLAHIGTDGKPYPIFVLSGLLVWQLVAQSCQHASTTIVANSPLVTRIFFPRILLPLASIAACLFDLLWVLGLLAIFMLWYGVAPTSGILAFFWRRRLRYSAVLVWKRYVWARNQAALQFGTRPPKRCASGRLQRSRLVVRGA